jgi:peptidylprolyl isomerase
MWGPYEAWRLAGRFFILMATLLAPMSRAADPPRTMADILAATTPSDWRALDPARTLYVELDSGRVIFELAQEFAPAHVANVIALAREGWYDGVSIVRAQDNFVVQWGDPDARRPVRAARRTLPPEFARPVGIDVPFVALQDVDGYAARAGFSLGQPAARDAADRTTWLAHCYGTLGVGRDDAPDSGGGTELYVVIGHAPRQLDRNVTVIGRAVHGMEHLATLPRGTESLGFYATAGERVPLRRVRLSADVSASERTPLEALRTDTAAFTALVEARRNRRDAWYVAPAGHIDVCNVPLPVRAPPST